MTGVWQYVVLLPFMCVATMTDARRQTIPNWLTYPGIVVGLVLNAVLGAGRASAELPVTQATFEGLMHGFWGFLTCGALMVVCLVFFGVGGGDVKLLAMTGAFLGLDHGLEAMLWTFVVAAVIGLGILIWQLGVVDLVRRSLRRGMEVLRLGRQMPMAEEDRAVLGQELFLALAALLAVGIQMWTRVLT